MRERKKKLSKYRVQVLHAFRCVADQEVISVKVAPRVTPNGCLDLQEPGEPLTASYRSGAYRIHRVPRNTDHKLQTDACQGTPVEAHHKP
jgi:hypothetical protein